MNIIARLLRAPEPASAELRRELDGLDIAGKATAVEELRARRRQQLVDDESSAALDKTERALTEAQRAHDRAIALEEELRLRLDTAEQRERIDTLAARKAAAEEESAALAVMVDDRLPEVMEFLRDLSERREAEQAERDAVNSALAAIGSTDRVEEAQPDTREPDKMEIARFLLGPQPSGREMSIR